MKKTFLILVVVGICLVFAGLLLAGEKDAGLRTDIPSPLSSPAPVVNPAAIFSPSPSSSLSPSPPSSPSPTPVLITPTQEVSGGFTRYIPDKNGDMEWELDGTTVKFLSSTCLEIMDMTATSLSAKIGYLTITVGKVLYYTDSRRAQADGERITVRRENMVLTGSGFLWSPSLKQIRVFEDVKVLIKEKGNIGLFPL